MSLEYPLEDLPPVQPGFSSTTDVTAPQTIDTSLLPRNGIPEIQIAIAGPSSVRPLHPYEGARPADMHSAPGFRAPRLLESPFGFGLEEPAAPVAGPSNAIKPRASTSNRKAPRLTAAGEKEKKKEQNRAWRARRKARLAAEKAARDRAAIIAAGGDPDVIAVQAAGVADEPSEASSMQVDDPVLPQSVQTTQVPSEVPASIPKVEAEEPHLLRSPSMPIREAPSLDAVAVPEALLSTSAAAPHTSSSVIVAPPEAAVASGSRDRSASFQNGVPRINGWGAAIDRVEPPNDHEANLLFNEGWILPQGSKRRRASSANTEASGPVLKSRKGEYLRGT